MAEPQAKPARRPRAVYCFFDNTDEKLRAPADAKTLMKKLGLRWQATPESGGAGLPTPGSGYIRVRANSE
jgi:hypothetical protein